VECLAPPHHGRLLANLKVIHVAKTAAHGFEGINNPTETFEMIEFKKYKSRQHPLQAIFALGLRSIQKYG